VVIAVLKSVTFALGGISYDERAFVYKVGSNGEKTVDIILKNDAVFKINILKIITSCPCVSARIERTGIAPGECGLLTAITTAKKFGEIILCTDEKQSPVIRISIGIPP